MPSRSRAWAACCIVSQSDWLPMMMPIAGAASVISILPFRVLVHLDYRSGARPHKRALDVGSRLVELAYSRLPPVALKLSQISLRKCAALDYRHARTSLSPPLDSCD